MSGEETGGFIAVILILGSAVGIAWYLVYVVKVEWFRKRLLQGNRTQRMTAMLPIIVPIAGVYYLSLLLFSA